MFKMLLQYKVLGADNNLGNFEIASFFFLENYDFFWKVHIWVLKHRVFKAKKNQF